MKITTVPTNNPETAIWTKANKGIASKTRISSRVIKAGSLVGVDQPIRIVGAISVISRSAVRIRNAKARKISTQANDIGLTRRHRAGRRHSRGSAYASFKGVREDLAAEVERKQDRPVPKSNAIAGDSNMDDLELRAQILAIITERTGLGERITARALQERLNSRRDIMSAEKPSGFRSKGSFNREKAVTLRFP